MSGDDEGMLREYRAFSSEGAPAQLEALILRAACERSRRRRRVQRVAPLFVLLAVAIMLTLSFTGGFESRRSVHIDDGTIEGLTRGYLLQGGAMQVMASQASPVSSER